MFESNVKVMSEIGMIAVYPFYVSWLRSMAFPIRNNSMLPTLSSVLFHLKKSFFSGGVSALFRGYWIHRIHKLLELTGSRFKYVGIISFYPMTVILTRVVISNADALHVIKVTIKTDGYSGLWKGIIPTVMAHLVSDYINKVKDMIEKRCKLDPDDCELLDASAAMVSLTMTLPLIRLAAVLRSQSNSDLFPPVQSVLEIVKGLEWREMMTCFSTCLFIIGISLKVRN